MAKYLFETYTTETIINKSRFLTFLFSVTKQNEVEKHLKQLRELHPKANHVCYASIILEENYLRFSDDGEPNKTAGFPMFDVLEKNNMDEILAVVVRYFGGIKLGSGGLTRAYRSCVASALKETKLVNKIPIDVFTLEVDYALADTITHLFKQPNNFLLNTNYQLSVTFEYYSFDELFNHKLTELTGGIKPTYLKTIKVIKYL